jgi:hypothetical protein
MNVPGTNSGHGYVWKRPDGMIARCGGPGMCRECAKDKERVVTVAADIQTVYLAAVEEKAAIMKELEDVPGATALEKVKRLKSWYQQIYHSDPTLTITDRIREP